MAAAKRVTISDIARLAGVSPGAVSFALNGRPGVSEKTRRRILEIAHEQHWRPSYAARALGGSRVGVIGLVIQRPARTIGAEAFFVGLISGIQDGLSETRTSMQMRIARDLDDEIEAYRLWHSARQVDGVIVIDPREDDQRLTALRSMGLPAVVVGSAPAAPGEQASVWIDDGRAAHVLFDYLAALGHRRIAYVSGPADLLHTRLRNEVLDALGDDGDAIVTTSIATDFSPSATATATRRLLSARPRPTAVVYDNEVMAAAGMGVTQEMGIAVPEAVSVASFDDSVIAELMHPSITSLTRDTFELGALAAGRLLAQIDSNGIVASAPGPEPTLSVRESTAPPERTSPPRSRTREAAGAA